MNNEIVNKLITDYGVLGCIVVIFATVIKVLDNRHERTINRIEKEKTAQITELKKEIKDLRAEFSQLSGENHVILRDNSNTVQRNTDILIEVGHLLRDLLSKRLES